MPTINANLWKPATDFTKIRYENEIVPVTQVFAAAQRAGHQAVRGRVFINCQMVGPAVIVSLESLLLNGCHLGDVDGDVRKMLYKPMSDTAVTGAVPYGDCVFDACVFHAVGFTGSQAFIDSFLASFPLLS